ncbi:glycosyltransferase family 22 protein [Lentithecium fluviatile CBS 122367]|uniref:Mannosyltransferase n=1 Tax=Lentithecium fluviatile CBS 122367 TaxID=1168545 RepID=A0A6G1IX90_9PLEO|nr:glycosyltransferase family 22 protein [Lentithecium fluviatile CBS 122367]
MAKLELLVYLLIPTFVLIHLFVSPYTKVEESFNIQAIHDILFHSIPTKNVAQFFDANYDHVSFPGSVPRTFVGALALSALARPLILVFDDGVGSQFLVRAVLGALNSWLLIAFGQSVQRNFGLGAGIWYALFQASQFHVIYYASRTLPNMFAFSLSTFALRSLLNAYAVSWNIDSVSQSYRMCLAFMTLAGVVFRSELAILVGTLSLYLLIFRRVSLFNVIIPAGIIGATIGLFSTVAVDSFFWQSIPIWPEWTAFYYNTILGHSADWGVSPWHYYFANALPRLMLNPLTYLVCIPVSVLNAATRRRGLDLLVPLLGFVGLYSFLPHKEWRFIVYVIPGLTAVAASGAAWIWTRRAKSVVYAVLSLALVASVLVSFVASIALLAISSLNYPGGEGLYELNNHIEPSGLQNLVYFDNLACQTGVTRFLENHEGTGTIYDVLEAQDTINKRRWIYDKTEDPEALLDPMFWDKFDFVLAERPEKVIGQWGVVHVVYGFGGVKVMKPGEKSGSPVEALDVVGWEDEVSHYWTAKVARLWKSLEGTIRDPLLRGWWVEVRMEPKIRILENRMRSPPEPL